MPSASCASRSPRDRRTLDEEAALGADRHDHGVLHHLRLDQAQHLGAEILAAVGPAQAAARDRAEAQVHALHARRVHQDLAVRHRLRQVRHLVRIELEADVVGGLAVPRLEETGAQGGADQRHEAAQDAVLVEAGDVFQQDLDASSIRPSTCCAARHARAARPHASTNLRMRVRSTAAGISAASRFAGACAPRSCAVLSRGFRGADRSAPRTIRPTARRSPDSG